MDKGKIVQITGPVIDVEFESDNLPAIKDALTVELNGKTAVMEVSQHIGGNVVRCIMMASSEGLSKSHEVINTHEPIKVPVGKDVLGRMFNMQGETIDGGEKKEWKMCIRDRGIIEALEQKGIQEGDTVKIYNLEFDYYK